MSDVFCAVTSIRTPSVDERGCLNSASQYERRDLLEEDKNDADWSPTDRWPDQQTADIIWYIHKFLYNCDMVCNIL